MNAKGRSFRRRTTTDPSADRIEREAASLLVIDDAVKRYGDVVALDGVTLSVRSRQSFGLLGPNGAGKTTLLSCVCGLESVDDGDIRVAGAPVASLQALGSIGYAAQNTGIYNLLTVYENLQYQAMIRMPKSKVADAVDGALVEFGLRDVEGRLGHRLSGGQRRLVHLAVAMIHDPSLIILDEPTASLDAVTRARVIEIVRRRIDGGAGLLITSHDFRDIEELCDSVGFISSGQMVANGGVSEVLARHGAARVSFAVDGPQRNAPDGFTWTGQTCTAVGEDATELLSTAVAWLRQSDGELRDLRVAPATLEQVFFSLTGTSLS